MKPYIKHPFAFLALLPSLLFAAVWNGDADTTWYTNDKDATEYTITTAEELAGLARLVNGTVGNGTYSMNSKTIKLGNNIVLNDTTNWRNWATSNSELKQWTPIGTAEANRFKGTFDGDGYTVSGVYINGNGQSQGLFGMSDGTIKNLGVVASYIKGDKRVGGLMGFNNNAGGTITNSYATGNVSGTSQYVGGLVGHNAGPIINSYATGNVSSGGFVGGLAGSSDNGGSITNSYATGNVSGTGTLIGGLVGYSTISTGTGTITNSYYDKDKSGATGSHGTGLTTDQMKSISSYNSWDFTSTWSIVPAINNGYPVLKYQLELPRNATVSITGSSSYVYSGSPITPEVTVVYNPESITLVEDRDYTVSHLSNVDPTEEAEIIITGIGSYSGTVSVFYEIEKIKASVVWQEPFDFEYNGQNRCPSATATLPIALSITCEAVNASTEPYTATAAYDDTYELLNSTVQFTISRAPITATLEIPNITEGVVLSQKTESTSAKENPAIEYWYSTGKYSAYTKTAPATEGVYYAYAAVSPTSNYLGGTTDTISFSIYKAEPVSIQVSWSEPPYSFVYNGTEQYPDAEASIDGKSFPLTIKGATEAGTHTAIARFQNERTDYKLTNVEMKFTIAPKPLSEDAIEPMDNFSYTSLPIYPQNITVRDGSRELAKGIDYTVSYGVNIFELGIVSVTGIGNYSGTVSCGFIISSGEARQVPVIWDSVVVFVYDGASHAPTARTAEGIDIEVAGKTDAGNYVAVAQLKIPDPGILLIGALKPYAITKKQIEVSWEGEKEYVYNKMTQGPTPSVDEPNVELRVSTTYSGVGKYTAENKRAPYAAIISSNAGNYELLNNSVDYEILPRPLQPRFSVKTPAEDFDANADTVWVPRTIFSDSTLLRSTLAGIIDYDGFAIDTVSKEADNISALKGTPKVTLQYAQASPSVLSKRVETTQKATATIITEEVSADNYILVKRDVVVMEAISEADNAPQIFCKKNASCASMSEASCAIIGGEAVPTCTMFCAIEDACAPIPVNSCAAMGGRAVETCEDVPVLRPALSTGTFRVWQTASGVVNVDLGYMPSAPIALKVYDLKGKVVATEQVNTRFANVRIEAVSGVYLFKVGSRVIFLLLQL